MSESIEPEPTGDPQPETVKKKRHRCKTALIVIGAIFGAFIVLVIIGAIFGDDTDTETSTSSEPASSATRSNPTRPPQPTSVPPTPLPPTPPPSITAIELWEEREANATRYDQQRKDTWVRISGLIGQIDGGEIRLVVDEDSFELLDIAIQTVNLHDLPTSVQVSVNKGERFEATCKVGSFIITSINLRDCRR